MKRLKISIFCLKTKEWIKRQELPAKEILTIGRLHLNDVVLSHPTISNIHAQIFFRREKLFIRDLGSKNGTYINGFPLANGQLVAFSPRDIITLSFYLLKVEIITNPRKQEGFGDTSP